MTSVVDIQNADDPRDVIHQAVQVLADGNLVAFPTETVYVVAAQSTDGQAVQNLRDLIGTTVESGFALAVKDAQEALDYVPQMPPLARKLIRRCWPGPVILNFPLGEDGGLLQAFPPETRRLLLAQGELQLRSPAETVIREVQRLLPAPLVLSPETLSGTKPVTTAAAVKERWDEAPALIIDKGTCRYGDPASVVEVNGDCWKLLNAGVVGETALARLTSEFYLFVCTGNTCRSPMAEALFRKMLADKLPCEEDELPEAGFVVASAGLAAAGGAPASPEAVDLLRAEGVDISAHATQPLTNRLLEQADHIYTMTAGHRDSILAERPDLVDRVALLSRQGTDVSDPIGGSLEDYQWCKDEIRHHLEAILDELPLN